MTEFKEGGRLTKDADTANIWEDDGGLCQNVDTGKGRGDRDGT